MSNPFPDQLRDAARLWNHSCSAFAQFRSEGHPVVISLRLQAPEIMAEFVGEVRFGRDPRGILFYHAESDFKPTGKVDYTFFYRDGQRNFKTVQVDFFEKHGTPPVNFARFLANVDISKFPLPNLPTSPARGEGNWKRFIAATTQSDIHSRTNSRQINMTFPPIWKQVDFQIKAAVPNAIDTTGVLIFPNLRNLKTKPDAYPECVVDYAPDRVVFHPLGIPEVVIALLLPSSPLPINDPSDRAKAIWSDYTPPTRRHLTLVDKEEAEEEAEEVEEEVGKC